MSTTTVYLVGNTGSSNYLKPSLDVVSGSGTLYPSGSFSSLSTAIHYITTGNTETRYYVHTTLGAVLQKAGISLSAVTKIKVTAQFRVGYHNYTSYAPVYGQSGVYANAYCYSAIGGVASSTVTVGNDSSVYTTTYEATSFNSSTGIHAYGDYKTGDYTFNGCVGVACTSMFVTITYEQSCDVRSAVVSNSTGNSVDCASSAKSLSSSNGSISVSGTYVASGYSSTTAKWENSEGYVYSSSQSGSFYMQNPSEYLQFKVYSGSTIIGVSSTCHVTTTIPSPMVSVDSNCVSATVSVGSSRPSGYYYKYELCTSGGQRVSISSSVTSSTYTFSNLSPNTQYRYYVYIVGSSGNTMSSSTGLVSTTNAVVNISSSDLRCDTVKLEATDSCGATPTLKYSLNEVNFYNVVLNSAGYVTTPSMSGNNTYYFKAVSSNVESPTITVVTPSESTSMKFRDGSDEYTSGFNLDYPRSVLCSASSNSYFKTVHFEYTTEVGDTGWTSLSPSGQNVPVLYSNKNYRFRSYILDGSTRKGEVLATLTVDENNNRFAEIWRSDVSGSHYEAEDGGESKVYPTGSSTINFRLTSKYDNSPILTRTFSYTLSGTTYTSQTLSFRAEEGNTYAISGTVTYKYNGNTITSYTLNSYTVRVITFTTGKIYATSQTLGQTPVVLYGTGATAEGHLTTAGENVMIYAGEWGSGDLRYEYSAYTRNNSSSQWATMSTDDGILYGYGDTSYYCVLIPYSTDKQYAIRFLISSIDDVGHQESSTPYKFTVGWLTARIGIVSDVIVTPDPAVGKIDSTEFNANASNSYVKGHTATLTYNWSLLEYGLDVTDDKVDFIDCVRTDDTIKFTVNANGIYTLRCSINGTYSGGTLPETVWEYPLEIRPITLTGISDFNRFALVFYKGDKCFVATRHSAPYFTSLTFDKYLSNIGVMNCVITGTSKVSMTDESSVESLMTEPGTYVCLLDRMNPIWIGIVTNPASVDTNYYDTPVNVSQYKVTAYECQKVLATDYIPDTDKGLLSGSLSNIVRKIIPEKYHGDIGTSSVNYGISLSNTSRLTALDQLYSQCGWKYRCRPNTISFWNVVHDYDGSSFTISDGEYEVGDVLVFYDGMKYGCGFVSATVGNSITIGPSFNLPSPNSAEIHVSSFRDFLIDFKPAYYQTYNTVQWTINRESLNTDVAPNIRDKFGTAIVYGIGYSGETIASKMRAWMKIEKDYTIADSMKITRSYDSEIDTVVKLDDVTYNNKSYSRYTITFNGWSFPDLVTLNRLATDGIKPRIYYVNLNSELNYMEIGYLTGLPTVADNPRRYYDQGNNKKCAYTISIEMVRQSRAIQLHYRHPLLNLLFNYPMLFSLCSQLTDRQNFLLPMKVCVLAI